MINPVFNREMQTTYRSIKIFLTIMAYILLLTASAFLFSISLTSDQYGNGLEPSNFIVFNLILTGAQMVLIMLIVIVFSSSGINAEKQNQTFDLMIMSKLTTSSIIKGKLYSTMSYAVLLMLASMPVFAIGTFYGATDIVNILVFNLFSLSSILMVACVSLFFSCIFKKQGIVVIVTILVLIFCVLSPFILYILWQLLGFSYAYREPVNITTPFVQPPISKTDILICSIFVPNQIIGILDVIGKQTGGFFADRFFESLVDDVRVVRMFTQIPYWLVTTITNFVISAILIFWSSKLIKPVKKSRRFK